MFKIRALLLIVFVAVVWADEREIEKPYIDYLTLEYLSLEQKLWTQINSGVDPTTLLSNVYEEHKEFIRNDFGVSRNTLAIYIPTGILVDNLRNVNDLFYNISSILVHNTPADIYYVHTILRDAVIYSEHIFNETIRADFWENGKDVSQFDE